MVNFPQPQSFAREWGTETLVAFLPGQFSGKVLFYQQGSKGGLQYHRMKHEFGYVISGLLLIRYEKDGRLVETLLSTGDCIEIPQGAVHQEEALTDCLVFETSTPYFNDRVRVEERYGLEASGLPTTREDEIRDTP